MVNGKLYNILKNEECSVAFNVIYNAFHNLFYQYLR